MMMSPSGTASAMRRTGGPLHYGETPGTELPPRPPLSSHFGAGGEGAMQYAGGGSFLSDLDAAAAAAGAATATPHKGATSLDPSAEDADRSPAQRSAAKPSGASSSSSTFWQVPSTATLAQSLGNKLTVSKRAPEPAAEGDGQPPSSQQRLVVHCGGRHYVADGATLETGLLWEAPPAPEPRKALRIGNWGLLPPAIRSKLLSDGSASVSLPSGLKLNVDMGMLHSMEPVTAAVLATDDTVAKTFGPAPPAAKEEVAVKSDEFKAWASGFLSRVEDGMRRIQAEAAMTSASVRGTGVATPGALGTIRPYALGQPHASPAAIAPLLSGTLSAMASSSAPSSSSSSPRPVVSHSAAVQAQMAASGSKARPLPPSIIRKQSTSFQFAPPVLAVPAIGAAGGEGKE